MTLVAMGLLAGTLLASLNVYILIPAAALTTTVVLLNGLAAGKSAVWYAVITVLTMAFLQLGYLAGTAALWAIGRRAGWFGRELGAAIEPEGEPHPGAC